MAELWQSCGRVNYINNKRQLDKWYRNQFQKEEGDYFE